MLCFISLKEAKCYVIVIDILNYFYELESIQAQHFKQCIKILKAFEAIWCLTVWVLS